ncbi:protein-tyrosine-phosphatase [Nocardiopsis gilva YIM 90087]|uniref:Protein-tyrosine-phosphatase n=1 Tax=Nocardiopsis gilva YIM 90087 TaxID=1235441 RepID=A0A223S4P3_9ACTN|nr:tyrosine-protein phosphatase [Nocardiopsis gilva]ASU83116.1 protein-tyrosine-phosphatase [Nocardiopsis gilva YIM 90087]
MTNDAHFPATAPNFRDLGGHTTRDGSVVRRGVVYRSDALSNLTDDELHGLGNHLGLRLQVDLRSSFEREAAADRVPEGVEYVALDVQGDHSTGADLAAMLTDPERSTELLSDGGGERFVHEVNRMLVSWDDALAGYRELIRLAATGPAPLVFHCSAGKDRTGWGAALLLALLDVPREAIVADYLASNPRLAQAREWMYGAAERHGVNRDLLQPLVEVREEYLRSAFDEADRVYGSFEGYVADGLKIGPETIDALRARFLGPR